MKTLLTDIRELILSARKAVAHSVNLIQVYTYFEIGCRIVEHEQRGAERARYGEALLKDLAASLTAEFGKGFSLTNLKLIRQFYLAYRHRHRLAYCRFLEKVRHRLTNQIKPRHRLGNLFSRSNCRRCLRSSL